MRYSRHRDFDVTLSVHPSAKTPEFMFRAIATPLVLHPHGWARLGYNFTVVPPPPLLSQSQSKSRSRSRSRPRKPSISIKLCPQDVMDALFPQFADTKLSVCNMATREIYVNEDRWCRKIQDDSQMSLPAYRLYVIQHELGHALGRDHASCGGAGLPAPIMLQQTLGLNNCLPFPFP